MTAKFVRVEDRHGELRRLQTLLGGIPAGVAVPSGVGSTPPKMADLLDALEASLQANREYVSRLADRESELLALQSDVAAMRRVLGLVAS